MNNNYDHFCTLVDMMFERGADGAALERYDGVDVRGLNPLVAAFVGDAYYHLYVRTRLLKFEQKSVHALNAFSAHIVSAKMQAFAYHKIEPQLTEAERASFKRGRNAHSHAPRKASVADYHASTGFEALLGELYLTKNFQRLEEIARLAFDAAAAEYMQGGKDAVKND